MEPAKYPCTQAELAATTEVGWNSYINHILGFSARRGYYDAAYGTDNKAAAEAANNLPDSQARYANVEVYRTDLTHLGDTCLGNWQFLKRLITTSFPADNLKARLEEAGADRYEKARNYNWDELKALNTSGSNFLVTHAAALSAGNNMVLTFPTEYSAGVTAFNSKYSIFMAEEEAAYNATRAKVIAFNEVYTNLINMFKDGQEIYKDDEGIRREFTFNTVLGLVSSPGQAGVRGIARSAATQLAIEGVQVMIIILDDSTLSDVNGRFEIKPVASGNYDIQVSCPGYETQIIPQFHIISGTVSNLDLLLVPIV